MIFQGFVFCPPLKIIALRPGCACPMNPLGCVGLFGPPLMAILPCTSHFLLAGWPLVSLSLSLSLPTMDIAPVASAYTATSLPAQNPYLNYALRPLRRAKAHPPLAITRQITSGVPLPCRLAGWPPATHKYCA